MIDTSFCETTDYDTDFIVTDNLETDYVESDIEGVKEFVSESFREIAIESARENAMENKSQPHVNPSFDLPMSQIPDSLEEYPEDDFITQQINGMYSELTYVVGKRYMVTWLYIGWYTVKLNYKPTSGTER